MAVAPKQWWATVSRKPSQETASQPHWRPDRLRTGAPSRAHAAAVLAYRNGARAPPYPMVRRQTLAATVIVAQNAGEGGGADMTKKLNIDAAPVTAGTRYPPPFDQVGRGRFRRRLGDAAGLTQFGVNLTLLPPGCWSSQRHWHTAEDEFVYVVFGEVVLVTDAGEEILRAGDCAGFKAGERDGHHLQNRSGEDAMILEVGTRQPDEDAVDYPDIDLQLPVGRARYVHRDGTPYENSAPRNPRTGK